MSAFSVFFLSFLSVLLFVVPSLFDPTMMSRLAVYPLVATVVLFFGRRSISLTHLLFASAIAFFPAVSLFWGISPIGGLPFAIRWAGFALMVAGFSGTVRRWGVKPHAIALVAASVVTSLTMILWGPDALTGNENRAGMVLALGFAATLFFYPTNKWFFFTTAATVLMGIVVSSFYTAWVASAAAVFLFFFAKRLAIRPWMVLTVMVIGQTLFSLFPDQAGRLGPTLELRARIWRSSFVLFAENLPLGTGSGSTRLQILNQNDPDLLRLTETGKRIDFLHSEPVTMITEWGIPGLITVSFLLFWLAKRCNSPWLLSLMAVFWIVFASDLPLATPIGALPAALFLAFVPPLDDRQYSLHAAIPLILLVFSAYWFFVVTEGYRAFANPASIDNLELAAKRIPWEERVFLVSGYTHINNDMVIAALEDSRSFLSLYPYDFRGWELRATTLSAAGRDSHSAWAKAALLWIPDDAHPTDGHLFAINAISPIGMDPDTALALAKILALSKPNIKQVTENMTPAEMLFVSGKMLELTRQCRAVSMRYAGAVWLTAMGVAFDSGEPLPRELAGGLYEERDLYRYINLDEHTKADEFLSALQNLLE